jgi:hypothetical protein
MEIDGMQTVTLRSHVGSDGMLHLDIPSEYTDAELDVTVTVRPVAVPPAHQVVKNWPAGFFDQVIGGWKGEPLVREEVGVFEVREEF